MELKRSINNNNNNSKKIYYPVAMYLKSKFKQVKSQEIWTLPKSPKILKVIINLLIDLSLIIWLF